MSPILNPKVETLLDAEALARRVADWLLELAVAKEGRFVIALSGGSTPKRLYQYLAETRYRDAFPWSRTHWFWGDERCVPPTDKQSNFRMVREAMLMHAPIPEANIHAVPTDGISPEKSAALYERDLKTFYGGDHLLAERPLFDVVLLGLGPDGHTASLFPKTKVLDERERWVAAVMDGDKGPRITLTYPVLESSYHVAFLIAGKDKRDIFARFRKGEQDLPAARLRPEGDVFCFTDEAAIGGRSS